MESKLAYLSEKDLQKIAIRPERSHKGTFGKLLVIAGGKGMAGAAILCGKAAYRNGVGLVKIYLFLSKDKRNRSFGKEALPGSIAFFVPPGPLHRRECYR